MRKKSGVHVASTIFVLLLLLGAFFVVATDTVTAAQDGDYTYTVSGSPAVATITEYTGVGGAITIPSTLGGYPVVAIGDNAFSYCTALTSVTIPNSVTSIGHGAFEVCFSLTSVTIGNGVTSIGDSAFDSCISLTSVTIPNNVTSIGSSAFLDCSSLTSVTVPNSVTSIGQGAFDSCTALIAIDVNAANANYASIDGVLYNKAATTLIQCPGGKAGALTMPSSVTTIGDRAFYTCIDLTSVTIGSGVTSIGGGAFMYCTSLTSVTIGSGVTSIGDNVFYRCASLISITFLGLVAPTTAGAGWILETPAGIKGHAYAASNFPAPGGVFYGLTMGTVIPDYWYNYNVSGSPAVVTITRYTGAGGAITIPSTLGGYPVVAIGNSAFYYCTSMTSVTIPNNVTSIGGGAFMYCTSLTSVTIPNNVTSIGSYAFYHCTNLTSVTIGSGVTSIGNWTFEYCTSLISVNIPSSVTSIGQYGFYSCTNLTQMRFEGNAPTCGAYWIDEHNPNLIIYYLYYATGFATPTWYSVDTVCYVPSSARVNLTINCDASTASSGFSVQITGNASHLLDGNKITGLDLALYYSVTSGETWNEITSVMTDANGSYSAWWTPAATDDYLVRAVWAGNETLENISSTVSLSVVAYADIYVFSVQSNSTVSGLSFNSTTRQLSFTVSGPAGSLGYTRIMISKDVVTDGTSIKVSMDGNQMNYDLTQTSSSWILYFTYHHSTHNIVATLSRSPSGSGSPSGISLLDLTVVVAFEVVIAIGATFALMRRKQR